MRSPEPEAHDKVLDNNPDGIGIWKCWFLRRGENWSTRRKTSGSKEENQQQTQPTSGAGYGNQTRDTCTLVGGERSHHCAIPFSSLKSGFGSSYAVQHQKIHNGSSCDIFQGIEPKTIRQEIIDHQRYE